MFTSLVSQERTALGALLAQATESKMFEVIWSPMQDKYIVRKCRIFHNDPEIVGTLEQCLTWVLRIQKEA